MDRATISWDASDRSDDTDDVNHNYNPNSTHDTNSNHNHECITSSDRRAAHAGHARNLHSHDTIAGGNGGDA